MYRKHSHSLAIRAILSTACAVAPCLAFAQLSFVSQPPHPTDRNGFLYQPSQGMFWDPSVIYANRQYYMYTMYGGKSVWLATSVDGVHWKDGGVVLKSEGFSNNAVWKQYVSRVGDRYIMDFGAFTAPGTNNNLLRFYESKDLVHWTHLYDIPIDTQLYLKDGRWDHMYMVPKDPANPSKGYLGYMVADPIDHGGFGMMESEDGVHYKPIKAPEIDASFQVPTLEVGGIKKFGSKYYLLGGNVNHYGFSGYGVYTYVSDSPMGPFHPDMDSYRLTGTSGVDGDAFVHVLAAFVQDSPDNLVSDPFTFMGTSGTDGRGVWFLPMRKAVVDSDGHLRLAYWTGNDKAKGDPISLDASKHTVAFPPGQTESTQIIKVDAAPDRIEIATDKPWRQYSWLDPRKTRKGVALLDERFDFNTGVILEGQLKPKTYSSRTKDARKTYAGFYIEGADGGPGTAIMLEIGEPQWRVSVIGKLSLDTDFHFEPLDETGPHCATVTGLDDGKDHTFRLWLRGGQMELYVDDLLMQSFYMLRPSGRIGFIAQESDVEWTGLKAYKMNLSEEEPGKSQEGK